MDFWDIIFSFFETGSRNLSRTYSHIQKDARYSDEQRQKAKELSREYRNKAEEIHNKHEEYRNNK